MKNGASPPACKMFIKLSGRGRAEGGDGKESTGNITSQLSVDGEEREGGKEGGKKGAVKGEKNSLCVRRFKSRARE